MNYLEIFKKKHIMSWFNLRDRIFLRLKELLYRYGSRWDKLSPDMGEVSRERRASMSLEEEEQYLENITQYAIKNINTPPKDSQVDNPYKYTPERMICNNGINYNKNLRESILCDEVFENSEYIRKYKLEVDIVVYRGVTDSVLSHNIESAMGNRHFDLYEKGFLFASLTKSTCLQGCKNNMRIYLSKGTCAFYSGNVNNESYLQEIVVQRGAKLKILSKDKIYLNCLLINTD